MLMCPAPVIDGKHERELTEMKATPRTQLRASWAGSEHKTFCLHSLAPCAEQQQEQPLLWFSSNHHANLSLVSDTN